MGSADPPPDPREVVLDAVEAGKMTPAEAERWAQDRNTTPFAAEPDFDPMREPSWDLGMIIAWIMTHDPMAVRRVAGAFRAGLREWAPIRRRHLENGDSPGSGSDVVGHLIAHGTDKLSIEVLNDIAMEYDTTERLVAPNLFPFPAFDELKRRAGEGECNLTGCPPGSRDRRPIEPVEWQDLGLEPDLETGQELALRHRKGGLAYVDVTASRADVLSTFRAVTAPPVDAPSNSTPPLRSGGPGRPSSMHLIKDEFERRKQSGEVAESVKDESKLLAEWLAATNPLSPRPTPKTIENNIRTDYRNFRSARAHPRN